MEKVNGSRVEAKQGSSEEGRSQGIFTPIVIYCSAYSGNDPEHMIQELVNLPQDLPEVLHLATYLNFPKE